MNVRVLILRLFFILTLLLIFSANISGETDDKKLIIILNSYHDGYGWSDQIMDGIRSVIKPHQDIIIAIEYLDSKRNIKSTYFDTLKQLLKSKYAGKKIDLIMTSDDNALDFALEYSEELFPGIPLVFCGIDIVEPGRIAGRELIWGVEENLGVEDTIDFARYLNPDLNEIFFITDSTESGASYFSRSRAIVSTLEDDISGNFLSDLSMEELLSRLSEIPSDAAVIYLSFLRDNRGKVFELDESMKMIAKASAAPVYCTWGFLPGSGILGGDISSGFVQGEYCASIALQVLEDPNDITIPRVQKAPHVKELDWNILKHHNFTAIPDLIDVKIYNRPLTFYEQNRQLFWSVISALILLIIWLLILIMIIARLHRAKLIIASSELQLKTTLSSIRDAVITTDTQEKILAMNPVAERMAGRTIEQSRGHRFEEVFTLSDRLSRDPEQGRIEKLINGKTGPKRIVLFTSPDGKDRLISDSAAPIFMPNGKLLGKVVVLHDVTEELAIQEQLHHSQKMDALGQLAGGVAHDFNNMLGGIIGAGELLMAAGADSPEAASYLKIILESAERAAGLTHKLLSFARKQEMEAAAIDIHNTIYDTAALLKRTISPLIKLEINLDAENSEVMGDPSQLQSAFLNICINAAHAMPDGGILSITTNTIVADDLFCAAGQFNIKPGFYIQVEIRDTGSGIPHDVIPQIFEPFFTTKGIGKGTGLGLAAVYGTVQQHKGVITVYSEEGQGTSFHILLPLSDKVNKPLPSEDTEVIKGSGSILVIDDEPVMRTTALAILENIGYKVVSAENGRKGLDLFQEDPEAFDLIILDMIMPEMGGYECFQSMQKLDPEVKVILSSGFAREDSVEEMKKRGLCGFVRKPYRAAALSRIVHDAITCENCRKNINSD